MRFDNFLDGVGNTPHVRLSTSSLGHLEVYAKLEFMNPTGSVKDRAASFMLERLLADGTIDASTLIVESSSGNLGIALAAQAQRRGLRFRCIIDPLINPMNETIIRALGAEVVKVTEPDGSSGFLGARLRCAREAASETPGAYWINQYANPLNARAYYETLGAELCCDFDSIDYLFVGVSSGGTISGVSRRVKERFPDAKIIAVDSVGSTIFGGPACARRIPGIGSTRRPEILDDALIDDVVHVDEASTVRSCHELLRHHAIFAGGSSGSVYAAIRHYFRRAVPDKRAIAIAILADRGERYATTIYDPIWSANVVAAPCPPPTG